MLSSKDGHKKKESDPKIRIGVPNKGRLFDQTQELLRRIGLEFEAHDRKLSAKLRNISGELLFLRAGDIPRYVAEGKIDLAITGQDLVEEYHVSVQVLARLGFGHTDLVVAVPDGSSIVTVKDLKGKSIATTFPRISQKFLRAAGVHATLVTVGGAVEVAPLAGLADAIIDLTASGSTLRMNNLVPLATIMHSEAVLIARMHPSPEIKRMMETIAFRVRSVIAASNKRYIMMNAPAAKLAEIKTITPGLASPTVMKLTRPGLIAVHSVIGDAEVWEVVDKLKKIGASGILVFPIEKLVP